MSGSADPRPTAIRWRVFALACATSFLLYLHRYTWNLVGPSLQDDLGLSNIQAGLLFSLFYYTYASGQIPSGVVVDRFGPHRFLAASILGWSIALASLGMSALLWVLALARLCFGAAQAGCYPALTRVTRNWFPERGRTVLQGWIATTSGRGGGAMSPIILGSLLMGALGLSWQVALVVLGGVGVAFGLLFWAYFRDSPAEHPGVNDQERRLIGSTSSGEALRASSPLSARRAARSRSVWFFVAQQFLDAGSDVAFVSLIGTYFLRARGFDIAKTGWLASLPLWGGALGGIAGGWLNDRLIAATSDRRWSRSGIGCAGKIAGCVALAFVVGQHDGVAAASMLFIAKFFSDWSQPTVWGACTDMGGRHTATLFSIVNTAGTLGGVVMPILFGALLDAYTIRAPATNAIVSTDWGPLFSVLSMMYLGSGLCWLFIDCTRSLDVDQPASLSPAS